MAEVELKLARRAENPNSHNRLNTLDDLVSGLTPTLPNGQYGSTLSSPYPLSLATNYAPITLQRQLLSYTFMTLGLVQTITCQPVEDAFRGGFTVVTDELDEDEKKKLMLAIKRPKTRRGFKRKLNTNAQVNQTNSDINSVMSALNWSRLYGGAGLIINTDQIFSQPLDPDKIHAESPLEFIACDRWELILQNTNIWDESTPCPFNYYGYPLNRDRVIKIMGTEAPSYIRQRLQGWGLSQIESCIRAINSFTKFESLIFELLDEAKVDVYKINGFNDLLITDEGTSNVQRRVNLSNKLKNFQNALAMDSEDDYTQKQITWSGLAEIWQQLRLNLSSSLKIPMNKLFGESATGFGGGQDALENYNSVVEQVRCDAEAPLMAVIELRCQQLFGFIPEFEIQWKPLKILDGVQEEEVKDKKQKRILDLFQQRLVTGREASSLLKMDQLLPIETEVSKGVREVEPMDPEPSNGAQEMAETAAKAAAKAKPPARAAA